MDVIGQNSNDTVFSSEKPRKRTRYLVIGILNLVIAPLYAFFFVAGIAAFSERKWNQLLPAARPYVKAEYIIALTLICLAAILMLLSGIMLVRRRNAGRYLAGLVMVLMFLFVVCEIFFDIFFPMQFPRISTINGITYEIWREYYLTYSAIILAVFPAIGFLVVRKRID